MPSPQSLSELTVHNQFPPQLQYAGSALTSNPASRMLNSRKTSEEQAMSSSQIQNRMSAAMLSDLLDSRKDVASLAELQKLSKTYAIDPSLLQTLARVVNSPSIGERTTVRSVEDGEEKVRSKVSSPMLPSLAAVTPSWDSPRNQALWVNPPI